MLKSILNIRQAKRVKHGLIISHLLLICLSLLLPCQATAIDGLESRRLIAGLELFPSFLAADQKIKTKQDKNGTLQLIIIYNNDKKTAEKMALRLQQIGKIKSIPIHTIVTQSSAFKKSVIQPAGIFISQKNVLNLNTIIQYGKQHSIITFSPFPQDLQQGVTGSISITACIRPEINMTTLKSSNLTMKPFFLRISTPYTH